MVGILSKFNIYMKTFFSVTAFILTAATALVSCDPAKEFEAELKVLDSCVAELNKIDSLYKGIEFDSLDYMVKHVLKNEELMKEHYSSDTINMELGMLMNNSKGIRKSLSNIKGNQKKFGEEIAALSTQFDNLRTDIINGVLDKEQIDQYLATEKADLEKLNLSFMEFYTIQKEQSGVYYMAVPKVDEYIKLLNIPVEDTLQ